MAWVEAELNDLRSAVHRYFARMVGSVIDGEDIVQETMVRLYAQLARGERPQEIRRWVFQVAHNCAVDRLRKEGLRVAEPIEAAADVADEHAPDALELLMHREAVSAALSRFMKLPIPQRSAVILKDVLGHSLEEIADLLQTSVGAVKAFLNCGRDNLRAADHPDTSLRTAASPELLRYLALFNARDWDALRLLLAEDVLLVQTARAERRGRRAVSAAFFAGYEATSGWHMIPALVQSREVAAVVLAGRSAPAYFMLLDWQGGLLTSIRDFRYARYVMDGADLIPLPPGSA